MSNCIMPPWGVVGREFRGSDYCLRFQKETLSKLLENCVPCYSDAQERTSIIHCCDLYRTSDLLILFLCSMSFYALLDYPWITQNTWWTTQHQPLSVLQRRIHDCVWISYKNRLVCFVLGPKLLQVPGVCMEFSTSLLFFFCPFCRLISSMDSLRFIHKNWNNPLNKAALSLIAKTQLIRVASNEQNNLWPLKYVKDTTWNFSVINMLRYIIYNYQYIHYNWIQIGKTRFPLWSKNKTKMTIQQNYRPRVLYFINIA